MIQILDILGSSLSKELIVVYGLIALVVIFIVVLLIIDKVGTKKKKNLFDNKKLSKRLNELKQEALEEERKQASVTVKQETLPPTEVIKKQPEVEEAVAKIIEITPTEVRREVVKPEVKLEIKPEVKPVEVIPMPPKQEVKLETTKVEFSLAESKVISTEDIEIIEPYEDEIEEYIEPELEKTQAQIELEAITRELEKASKDEANIDKYARFEEEQEQNAIISYKELKERYDQLYDEGEKIQYANDNDLPINLSELYQSQPKQEEIIEPIRQPEYRPASAAYSSENANRAQNHFIFKSSPVISPVYGIQQQQIKREPVDQQQIEAEMRRTTEFLNSIKDLQKN